MWYDTTVEERIQGTCLRNNADYAIQYTQGRGHAITLASGAADHGFDYVVAVGGDGTINEVAQGLIQTNTPMGILPRGSGNGLARHLGIPVNLSEAIDNLFSYQVIRMDTLLVNNKLSLNVSGIGFDGHIANLFANKKTRGLFGYARLILREFFNFNEFEATVTIDGKTSVKKAFIIAVANSSQYGNNIKIAPPASVCDGLLDISIMKKIPLHNLIFIHSFLTGSLKNSTSCEMLKTKEVHLKTSIPVPFHIDGEPSGFNDTFLVQLKPASLAVLVPAGRAL
jgi:YegS/Rv2252/BmrU family lipid kinase